jgi:hypothetical protein
MGIETSVDHGGAESSFTSAIIAIEELAKVDPSVSVLCDVHNTLVNTIFRKYGTKEQQDKWLPILSSSKVNGFSPHSRFIISTCLSSSGRFVCPSLRLALMRSRCRLARKRMEITGSSTVQKCGSRTQMKPKCFSSLPTCVRYFNQPHMFLTSRRSTPLKDTKGSLVLSLRKIWACRLPKRNRN